MAKKYKTEPNDCMKTIFEKRLFKSQLIYFQALVDTEKKTKISFYEN